MSILNLPIEHQKAMAEEEGLTLDEWRDKTKRVLAEIQAFEDNLVIVEPTFTEDYTKEDFERFAQRIASANVAY